MTDQITTDDTPLTLAEAHEAISAILARIPDHLLPQPRIEKGDRFDSKYGDTHWFGGHGYYVGSCRDGKGDPIPNNFRRTATSYAFEQESMQRREDEHWAARAATDGVTGE